MGGKTTHAAPRNPQVFLAQTVGPAAEAGGLSATAARCGGCRARISASIQARGGLDVYGLSAEFGLFPASEPIPWYERTMDSDRAHELQPHVMDPSTT